MPPEQLSGGVVTRQSDIYAVGVVLWEALTSRRLFDGETEALTLVRAIEGRIDPPSMYNAEIDSLADGVVLRGLARDPNDRFTTAREMALAIEQTIGLASPSEVGEWVEHIAADELGKRAARIAEIEQASLEGVGDPRIGSRRSPRSRRTRRSRASPSRARGEHPAGGETIRAHLLAVALMLGSRVSCSAGSR